MSKHDIPAEFRNLLISAISCSSFVKLVLSKPSLKAGDLKSVDIRMVLVKREPKLSFTYHHKTRDIVKNYTQDESLLLLTKLLQEEFNQARLYTNSADLVITKKVDGYEVKRENPSHKEKPELSHDRVKHHLINSVGKQYLHTLRISDKDGKIYKATQDKFRQINKYIEILDGLIKQLPKYQCLNIVDMGSGKGYLTFALYDYLVNTLKINAKITGVEYREDLVNLCNNIAKSEGFSGLCFVQGSIENYDCSGANVVIALHACDTATDDAVYKAIKAEASLIVVAPCCHKQIRREMKKVESKNPLEFLIKHGTYAERMAEMLTDGMRAQIMEIEGYNTNLFEFISDAHTPKNVMIVATKTAHPPKSDDIDAIKDSIANTKRIFGISRHYLESLLGL